MGTWRTVTEQDALSRMSEAEFDANAIAGQDTAPDDDESPLYVSIQNAIATVRAAIAQGGKCNLTTDTSLVPPSLVSTVLSIAVFECVSRVLSQGVVVQDARLRLYERALDEIDALREGKLVPLDDDGESEASSTGVKVVSFRRNRIRGEIV